jgi:2-oxo-4-hydroxy-4-carboxy--5-ureidoimidazoline (OHCU) decarboxylase
MSSSRLPQIASLPTLSTTERAAVLDALFEPCTALHTLSIDLLHTETFDSYNDLIASVGVQLSDLSESDSTSDTEWLDKILAAHPRLGEKKVESAQSQAEQAQLNTGSQEEAGKLRQLNVEYEEAFPGLRYVY